MYLMDTKRQDLQNTQMARRMWDCRHMLKVMSTQRNLWTIWLSLASRYEYIPGDPAVDKVDESVRFDWQVCLRIDRRL